MFNREKTKTSLFLLPLLTFESKEDATAVLWNMGLFNNSYLKVDIDEYISPDKTISLHYNWKSGRETFDRYEELLKNNFKGFTCIDAFAPDKTSEMLVYDIPKEYSDIYELFINGKYSYFPDKYKLHILKFTKQPLDGKIHRILYKSKLLREELEAKLGCKIPESSELYDPPYLEQETFTNDMKVNKNQLKIKL